MSPIYWIFLVFYIATIEESECRFQLEAEELLIKYAKLTANATCGLNGRERYCRLVNHGKRKNATARYENAYMCTYCYDKDPNNRHPIEFAKGADDSKWWQSPSLAEGREYENVDIVIDLNQVYHIFYVMLKMGDSPRPGNWILERSIDGVTYEPWVYFAEDRDTCIYKYKCNKYTDAYRPDSLGETEVYCTSWYSNPNAVAGEEIIIPLISIRQGFQDELGRVSQKLIRFLSARYIRLRFQKILTLAGDRMTLGTTLEENVYNRYYYSIRQIEIGGRCICYGHADRCITQEVDGVRMSKCECRDNTCGKNCEKCCNLYNHRPWRPSKLCEECNCNDKANKCVYNQTVANQKLSFNKIGMKDGGGGVCIDCKENTAGINCASCKPGYYRPREVDPKSSNPCRPCQCSSFGSEGVCVPDDKEYPKKNPGDCYCKEGYSGANCDECTVGFTLDTNTKTCVPCECNIKGSLKDQYKCKRPCNCKKNVDPDFSCKKCKPTFFNLDKSNPEGCSPCFCFGLSTNCRSLDVGSITVNSLDGWIVSSLDGGNTFYPNLATEGYLRVEMKAVETKFNMPSYYYWSAPKSFLGNLLTTYGGTFNFIMKIGRGTMTTPEFNLDPEMIIEGSNGLRFAYRLPTIDLRDHRIINVIIHESKWTILNSPSMRTPTEIEFRTLLADVTKIFIKAKYTTDQETVELRSASLARGNPNAVGQIPHVERCTCPTGYAGLSCESCILSYHRVDNILFKGRCEKCECNGQSDSCDPYSGHCLNCRDNTMGKNCELCKPGFIGDPIKGQCDPCPCPLSEYNKGSSCMKISLPQGRSSFVCTDCQDNTDGSKCHKCARGFYGDPLRKIPCKSCPCNNNEEKCDQQTGACICGFNTEGPNCERCKTGYYGDAVQFRCAACDCSPKGSSQIQCGPIEGQCKCREGFTGRKCNQCKSGYGGFKDNCPLCKCNPMGTLNGTSNCDPNTGECQCKLGIEGKYCDRCKKKYFDLNHKGCQPCLCSPRAFGEECDSSGQCNCTANVIGKKCTSCQANHYWTTKRACGPCKCDPRGSTTLECNMNSGQCPCAPNVEGRNCDRCDYGYYGLGLGGCKKCPNCRSGLVCDDSGQCTCPPNTVGSSCDKCAPNAWGYDPIKGCKMCDCAGSGIVTQQCHNMTGECHCAPKYTGYKCDKCLPGFFAYPNCFECRCDSSGSTPDSRNGTRYSCDVSSGQCDCKNFVMDPQCNKCKPGTFGPFQSSPLGCYPCYCSGKSDQCRPLSGSLNLRDVKTIRKLIIGNPLEIEPSYLIPSNIRTERIPWPIQNFTPLYQALTDEFFKDLVDRYSLNVLEVKFKCQPACPPKDVNSYPPEAVIISYGGEMVLTYQAPRIIQDDQGYQKFEVKLEEKYWTLSRWRSYSSNTKLMDYPFDEARSLFVFGLLNVTAFKFLVLPSYENSPSEVRFEYKTVEPAGSGEPNFYSQPLTGVEQCICTKETQGRYCQDPGPGYFKKSISWPKIKVNVTIKLPNPIEVDLGVVPQPKSGIKDMNQDGLNLTLASGGEHGKPMLFNETDDDVKPCMCNGHSIRCDPNTGKCLNCANNTRGDRCELCAARFHGDPRNNSMCQECFCTNKEFWTKCISEGPVNYRCECKPGYTSQYCGVCALGFYGDLSILGELCLPCDCSPAGSLTRSCSMTGQCTCLPGISGQKCDQCQEDHVVQEKKCKNCREGCTGNIFVELDKGKTRLDKIEIKDDMRHLKYFEKELKKIKGVFDSSLANRLQSMQQEGLNYERTLNEAFFQARNWQIAVDSKKISFNEMKAEIDNIQIQIDIPALESRDSVTLRRTYSDEEMKQRADIILNILKSIQNQAKLPSDKDIEMLKRTQQEILNQIMIYGSKTFNPRSVISNLSMRIMDLRNKNDDVRTANKMHQKSIVNIPELIADIQTQLKPISPNLDHLRELNSSSVANYNQAWALFNNNEPNSLGMSRDLSDLLLKITNTPWLGGDIIDPKVSNYVKTIESISARKIQELLDMNNSAEKARKAFNAYSDIIASIRAARNSTDNSLTLLENIGPKFQVNKWKETESGLLSRRNSLENRIPELLSIDRPNILDYQRRLNESITTNVKHNATLNNYRKLIEDSNVRLIPQIREIVLKNSEKQDDITNKDKDVLNRLRDKKLDIDSISKSIPQMEAAIKYNGEVEILAANVSHLHGIISDRYAILRQNFTKFQEKMLRLRERLHLLHENMELAHGAAANSPASINLYKGCVRTYQTYYLTKSSHFRVDFWVRLRAYSEKDPMLIMFGQRMDYKSINFAFYLENRKFKFRWSSGFTSKTIELQTEILGTSYWYRLRAEVVPGEKAKFQVITYPQSTESDEKVTQVREDSEIVSIEGGIILDSSTLLFLGGPPPAESVGKIAQDLANLKTFEGCLIGMKLQGQHLGLEDFVAVSEKCDYTDKSQHVYSTGERKQNFHCRIDADYEGIISQTDRIMPEPYHNLNQQEQPSFPLRQAMRSVDNLFYDFREGQGYLRLRASELGQKYCQYLNLISTYFIPANDKPTERYIQLLIVIYNPIEKLVLAIQLKAGGIHYVLMNKNDISSKRVCKFNSFLTIETNGKLIIRIMDASGNEACSEELLIKADILCHNYTTFYFGGISQSHSELNEELKKMNVTHYSFEGRVGINSNSYSNPMGRRQYPDIYGHTRFVKITHPDSIGRVPTWPERSIQFTKLNDNLILLENSITQILLSDPANHPISFTFQTDDKFAQFILLIHAEFSLSVYKLNNNLILKIKINGANDIELVKKLSPTSSSYAVNIFFFQLESGGDKYITKMYVNNEETRKTGTINWFTSSRGQLFVGPEANSLKTKLCIMEMLIGNMPIDFKWNVSSVPSVQPHYEVCTANLFPPIEIYSNLYKKEPQMPCAYQNDVKSSYWFKQERDLVFCDDFDNIHSSKVSISLRFSTIGKSTLTLFSSTLSGNGQKNLDLLLINGTPVVRLDNKEFKIPLPCNDNRWHTITLERILSKSPALLSANIIALTLNGVYYELPAQLSSSFMWSSVQLGGSSSKERNFVGCIKDVLLNNSTFIPSRSNVRSCIPCAAFLENVNYVNESYTYQSTGNLIKIDIGPIEYGFLIRFLIRPKHDAQQVFLTTVMKTTKQTTLFLTFIKENQFHFKTSIYSDFNFNQLVEEKSKSVRLQPDKWNSIDIFGYSVQIPLTILGISVSGNAPVDVDFTRLLLNVGSKYYQSFSLGSNSEIPQNILEEKVGFSPARSFTGCIQNLEWTQTTADSLKGFNYLPLKSDHIEEGICPYENNPVV